LAVALGYGLLEVFQYALRVGTVDATMAAVLDKVPNTRGPDIQGGLRARVATLLDHFHARSHGISDEPRHDVRQRE
jgi:hypothetical protein